MRRWQERRTVLMEAGVDDRVFFDYVTVPLGEFRYYHDNVGNTKDVDYLYELLEDFDRVVEKWIIFADWLLNSRLL